MSNCRAIAIAALVLCMVVCGCSEKSTPPRPLQLTFLQGECRPGSERTLGTSQQSACLDHGLGAGTGSFPSAEGVRFTAGHDTLYVYHDSAWYNCCSLIRFDVEMHDTVLEFTEVDTAHALCDCMCHFDLASFVYGLARGTYTARLWAQNRTTLLGEAEVFVPGTEGLLRPAQGDPVWFEALCDTLVVHHDDRAANCCSKIIFEFAQQGNVLNLTERDTASALCHCMCNYDLSARVSGLPEGQYTVQVWDGSADTLFGTGQVQIAPCP